MMEEKLLSISLMISSALPSVADISDVTVLAASAAAEVSAINLAASFSSCRRRGSMTSANAAARCLAVDAACARVSRSGE